MKTIVRQVIVDLCMDVEDPSHYDEAMAKMGGPVDKLVGQTLTLLKARKGLRLGSREARPSLRVIGQWDH